MKLPSFDFVQAGAVRRAVVPEGDIREDIAFQNDINGLLARLDASATPPMTALGWIQEPVAPPPSLTTGTGGTTAPQSLRIIRGGLGPRPKTHQVNDVAIDFSPVAVAARRSS